MGSMRHSARASILGVFLCSCSAPAAEPSLVIPGIADCRGAQSGLEFRECLGRVGERVEAQMVEQWRLTLSAVREEDGENRGQNKPNLERGLVTSQEAWLRYREAECTMIAEQAAGGTGMGELYVGCSIMLTMQRIDLLRRRASDLAFYEIPGD